MKNNIPIPTSTHITTARSRRIAAILIAAAFAQKGFAGSETLECGARIMSNQPFAGGRLCLFVEGTSEATRVAIHVCSGAPGELWKIVRHDGGGVYLLSAATSAELRMDVKDFSHADQAAIEIWGPTPGPDGYRHQAWDFVPLTDGFGRPLGSMIMSVDSGKCLNVPLGRSPLDHEVLQQYACSRAPNDTWVIQPVMSGCE